MYGLILAFGVVLLVIWIAVLIVSMPEKGDD